MTNAEKRAAYMRGYLLKEAALGDFAEALGERGVDATKSALIFAPLVGGALTGMLASKLTSPEGQTKVLQQALVTRELEETLMELQRRKALALLAEQSKNGKTSKQRSLHI